MLEKISPEIREMETSADNNNFQKQFLRLILNLKNAFEDGNPSNVLAALIDVNQLISVAIPNYFENEEFIDKLVKSKIILNLIEIAFELDETNEDKELFYKNSFNALTTLHYLSTFSKILSSKIGASYFWVKFRKNIHCFDPNSILIGLSIGINILIDGTKDDMILYNKQGVTQLLVDIASINKFSENTALKIAESTQIMACYGLYIFNYRARVFYPEYYEVYFRNIALLILDVPELGKIHLLHSINIILQSISVNPSFLFELNDEIEFIENLLEYSGSDNYKLRSAALYTICYALRSDFVGNEAKEEIIIRLPWTKYNDLFISDSDVSGCIDVVYYSTLLGEDYVLCLNEYNTYQVLVENVDDFKYQDRNKILSIILVIIQNGSQSLLEIFLKLNIIDLFSDMLGNESTFDNDIISALERFTFLLNSSHHAELIQQFENSEIVETLLDFIPNDLVVSILKRLEYFEILENLNL
ncbi:hypothetical protein TVAG_166710 [Trichomonas vaginalis G3]|uniref:Uncharacterized protein n=1 Tax=Trichomonas vaginalis (strain ATCC PRA-98 / G3) TaxID=412133 RepID=A2DE78_TRIV3|nr:armadillo (ARM) repeat-containing protein family [Trichomonas vaginalis G3]EAY21296.1 hypothetical protein TVAG_166710 [Trichomonas vaginalis G3]KAI5548870.1 armadillo (ARM) repeat-containing protein family [Trichomonas vaginalis G3]|eukprot:XP_001582282.1 hypothetical protein [Trichomonas vaginalis G3]